MQQVLDRAGNIDETMSYTLYKLKRNTMFRNLSQKKNNQIKWQALAARPYNMKMHRSEKKLIFVLISHTCQSMKACLAEKHVKIVF